MLHYTCCYGQCPPTFPQSWAHLLHILVAFSISSTQPPFSFIQQSTPRDLKYVEMQSTNHFALLLLRSSPIQMSNIHSAKAIMQTTLFKSVPSWNHLATICIAYILYLLISSKFSFDSNKEYRSGWQSCLSLESKWLYSEVTSPYFSVNINSRSFLVAKHASLIVKLGETVYAQDKCMSILLL